MRRVLGLGIGVGLGLLAACADGAVPAPTMPPDDDAPPPDTRLDPARLAVGDYIATPCALQESGDGLAHLRDRDEPALVDIFFARASYDEPMDGPSRNDIDLVEAHGGRVLYRFHVPAVRARILLSNVPALVADGFWVTVRDVPDATRYDVRLSVGFTRPLTAADDVLIAELGGRVNRRLAFINTLSVDLPDRSVEALRRRPGVEYVAVGSVACLT